MQFYGGLKVAKTSRYKCSWFQNSLHVSSNSSSSKSCVNFTWNEYISGFWHLQSCWILPSALFEGTYHATQMVKQTRSFDESERVTVTSKAAKTWKSPKKRSCRVREMTCENIETLGEMLMRVGKGQGRRHLAWLFWHGRLRRLHFVMPSSSHHKPCVKTLLMKLFRCAIYNAL